MLMDGKGKYTFDGGNVYEGDWKDDRHGNRKYTYARGGPNENEVLRSTEIDLTETFCLRIIEKDLLPADNRLLNQQKALKLHKLLKTALPFDSASTTLSTLNPQLLFTLNDRSEKLKDLMQTSLLLPDQDKYMVVAVAPSGAGKTHLAHSLGKKWMFVTVIRIASMNGSSLSLPWVELINSANRILSVSNDVYFRAKLIYNYLELILSTYFEVTIDVLTFGFNHNLEPEQMRELLLRFFRNGLSDKIVSEKYCRNLYLVGLRGDHNDKVLEKSNMSIAELLRSVNSLRSDLITKIKSKFTLEDSFCQLTFCLDEAQTLLDQAPDSFIQRSDYLHMKTTNGRSFDSPRMRNLFYGLSCLCRDFIVNYNIGIYLTGTNFSIAKLDSEGNFESTNRGKIQFFESNYYFTLSDIILLVRHYFELSDELFQDPQIQALLRGFQGRPYFFVQYVFSILPSNIGRLNNNVAAWKDFLQPRLADLEQFYEAEMTKFFKSYQPIPGADHLTVKSLLPSLIKAVLCGTGHLFLRGDAIEEAITQRLIPLNATATASATMQGIHETTRVQEAEGGEELIESWCAKVVYLPEIEPTSYKAIRRFLLTELRKIGGLDLFLKLLSTSIQEEKGILVEQLTCYYLALSSLSFSDTKLASLYDLLAPLFPYHESSYLSYLNDLRGFVCNISCVIDVARYKQAFPDQFPKTGCDLSFLTSPTLCFNHHRSSLILFNFDNNMGVDMAMMIREKDEKRRLVVFQSKNWADGGLKDALLTLSPGLQYLKNADRVNIFRGVQIKRSQSREVVGFGSEKWRSYMAWVQTCSDLSANWVRVCLLAQLPTKSDYEHLHSRLQIEFQKKIKKISLRWDPQYQNHCKLLQAEMRNMPLFVLSYNSPHWIPRPWRDYFIPPATGTIGKPTKSRMEFRSEEQKDDNKFYFPVSIAMVEGLVKD